MRVVPVVGLVFGLAGAAVACGGDGGNGGSSYSIDAVGPAGSVSLPVADKTEGTLTEEDARDVLSSFNRLVAAVDSGDTLSICKTMPSWMRPGIENATLLVRNPGTIAGCASYLANTKRAMEPFRVGDFRRVCRLMGWPGLRAEGGQPVADVACLRFVKTERRKAIRAWPEPFTDPARFAALQYRFGFDRVSVFSKAVPERIALYRQSPSGGAVGSARSDSRRCGFVMILASRCRRGSTPQ